jgi:hypothetical protein
MSDEAQQFRAMEMLEISPDKVAHIILRAREVDAKTEPWDDGAIDRDDVNSETILEDLPGDATRQELKEFLDSLNEDELASLIALAWIGRGTYAPGELDEAIATAKAEHGSNAPAYLFSLPLLPDYLEDALDQLGYSVEDAERDVLGPS